MHDCMWRIPYVKKNDYEYNISDIIMIAFVVFSIVFQSQGSCSNNIVEVMRLSGLDFSRAINHLKKNFHKKLNRKFSQQIQDQQEQYYDTWPYKQRVTRVLIYSAWLEMFAPQHKEPGAWFSASLAKSPAATAR